MLDVPCLLSRTAPETVSPGRWSCSPKHNPKCWGTLTSSLPRTCRFWGLQPLDEHAITPGRQNIAGTCCTSHPQHPTLVGTEPCASTAALAGERYLSSTPGWNLAVGQGSAGYPRCLCTISLRRLAGFSSSTEVAQWFGVGVVLPPPTPAAPSPIKGPGSGCVGSRAPDTADGVCKVRLPQVCFPWLRLKPIQLEL